MPNDAASTLTYKRYVVVMLMVIYVFNQVDRSIFTILMEPIKRELDLSDTELGFLAGPAMALFYAILGIPVARWADRSHRINIMSAATALWSSIVMLSAAVTNFWQFALARIGVGVGEAGFSAVAQSVITDYHTEAERTRAMSIFMLAIPIGGVVSSLAGGWISQAFGWRAAFIAAGLPGLVLAVLLKRTVREPTRTSQASSASARDPRPPLTAVLAELWRQPPLRHLAIAMTLSNLVAGGVLAWQAAFFMRLHGMKAGELGTWFAFIFGFGGVAGIWLSGGLSRIFKTNAERKQAIVLAASAVLACIFLVATLTAPTKIAALLLLLASTVMTHIFYAPSFSLVQGLSPPGMRATIAATIILFQILFAGVIGVQLTGVLSDAFAAHFGRDALRWAMVVMTPAALWSAFHFWLAARAFSSAR